jgi:hypothetical protein
MVSWTWASSRISDQLLLMSGLIVSEPLRECLQVGVIGGTKPLAMALAELTL